jgi:hypothetical protein
LKKEKNIAKNKYNLVFIILNSKIVFHENILKFFVSIKIKKSFLIIEFSLILK